MDLLHLEANPWNEEEERRYGNTRRLLALANDLGYKFDRPEDAVQQKRVFESYDSVKTLSLMKEISSAEEELNSVNREIGRMLMDKETHDITNMTKLETRLSKLTALSSHLADTVDRKSVVTGRLQTPYTGQNLLIDASLHKHVVEFFSMISPLLSDLSNLLDTISWTTDNAKVLSGKTNKTLVKLNSHMEEIKKELERINKLRDTVQSVSKSCSK